MNAALISVLVCAALTDRPDLTGQVVTKDDKLIARATVLIDSASVRQGTSPLCPSCYADCRKSAQSNEQGRFVIAAVDPELLFNLLVVAEGFRPTIVTRVDPAKGPSRAVLEPLDEEALDPKCILRGIVIDPSGRALVGARVSAQMFKTDAYSGFSPGIFDPVAVTNLRGEFVLTSTSPIAYADLKVEGNGVAPRIVAGRKPESNPHTIRMTRGVKITGRIVRNKRPAAGAAAGLVQQNRGATSWLGELSIGTDDHGGFTFANVAPDQDYFLYGLMGTFKDGGAVPVMKVHSGKDGETIDVGDLQVIRGHTIKGQVILADGKAIPPKTRLMVSREDAWDTQRVELDANGRFTFSGLPTEKYALYVQLSGYRVSPKNHSADQQNRGQLVGMIDQDIDNLKILLEPGND